MAPATVSIGILFNALVSAIVSGSALALVVFLRRRWHTLDLTMRAYSWFWWFTVLVWLFSAFRYLLIGFGYTGSGVRYADILVQSSVFLTGPALIYYSTLRVLGRPRLADQLSSLSFGLGLLGIWFILQPNGVPIREVSFFSADATINSVSFTIFSVEAATILILLLYDLAARFQQWWRSGRQPALFEALYSTAVVIYLVLGTIDESKAIANWTLVVFRLLYSGAFLFVYLVIVRHEAAAEQYLVADDGRPAAAYG